MTKTAKTPRNLNDLKSKTLNSEMTLMQKRVLLHSFLYKIWYKGPSIYYVTQGGRGKGSQKACQSLFKMSESIVFGVTGGRGRGRESYNGLLRWVVRKIIRGLETAHARPREEAISQPKTDTGPEEPKEVVYLSLPYIGER